jgi:oligopeptide transport system substrate-binding protein
MLRCFATFFAVLTLGLGIGPGCKTKVNSNERVIHLVETGPESLDPNLIGESAGGNIGMQMFEPLVTIPVGNGEPVPGGAVRWDIDDTKTIYTFYLRKEAKWSDGTPVTAADYLFSWERALNPKTQSRNAQHYWVIKGAQAYNNGDITDFSSVGVKALDPYTIQVNLVGPAPYFLELFTYVIFSPVPRHVVKKYGNQWTRPENIQVNGPFKLTSWRRRDKIVLEKNPLYWGAKDVWLKKIVNHHSESGVSALQWYEGGKVDRAYPVPTDRAVQFLRSGRKDMHIDPYMCIYYYVLNTSKPPFDDPRVRRAFNMALDKGRLTRHILGTGQMPATHVVPPMFDELRNYPELRGDPFDPSQARKLMHEAGYGPGGKAFPKVTLIYNTYETHTLIAEFFQRSIKHATGVQIEIQNMEWKTLLPKMRGGEYHIARSGWCADFPDPQDFVQVFHSDGANNYPQYKNPKFDEIINELRVTADQTKRNALSRKAEAMLNRDVPLLPIYFYTRVYMLNPKVKGFEPQQQDHHLMKYVYFGEKAGK